jgi:hypothetical protein
MEEPQNASFTERSNWSRNRPDSASPVAFPAKAAFLHV